MCRQCAPVVARATTPNGRSVHLYIDRNCGRAGAPLRFADVRIVENPYALICAKYGRTSRATRERSVEPTMAPERRRSWIVSNVSFVAGGIRHGRERASVLIWWCRTRLLEPRAVQLGLSAPALRRRRGTRWQTRHDRLRGPLNQSNQRVQRGLAVAFLRPETLRSDQQFALLRHAPTSDCAQTFHNFIRQAG